MTVTCSASSGTVMPIGFEILYARQFAFLPFPLSKFEAGVLNMCPGLSQSESKQAD